MALIENTPLFKEFQRIVETGPVDSNHRWTCQFHIGEENIDVHQILSIDFDRQYDKNYADSVKLQVKMLKGKYIHKLLNAKDNLSVTLAKIPVSEVGRSRLLSVPIETYRLRAFPLDETNYAMEMSNPSNETELKADATGMVDVEFQLLEPAVEKLRLKSVGGIFRKTTALNVIKVLFSRAFSNLDLHADAVVLGVEAVEPRKPVELEHVIVPHGTRLTELPTRLQSTYGIYGAGFSQYLQNRIWHFFPLFDFKRYQTTDKTLTVINAPPNRFTGIERTFAYEGGKLIVISTGKTTFYDDSEKAQLNQGNGVRFGNANILMEGWHSTKGNVSKVSRKENNVEIVATPRNTGLNAVFNAENRITNNPFAESSKLARRLGSHLEVEWENSNPDLIYPGMPVQYLYVKNNVINRVYGTVIRAHTFITVTGTGAKTDVYKSYTKLTLFVEKS